MYLLIQTSQDNGAVLDVKAFDAEDEAIDFEIDRAAEDGFFTDEDQGDTSQEDQINALRNTLVHQSHYADGGVLTTLWCEEGT